MNKAALTMTKAEAVSFVSRHAAVLDSAANPPNPFASSVWIRHFIEQVAQEDWRVVAPMTDGDDASFMLLYHSHRSPAHCVALTNYYASLFAPLASVSSDRHRIASALVCQLTGRRPRINTIRFAPLDGEAADTAALAAALLAQGWFVRRFFCFGNWTLHCKGMSFEAYMARRDSQLRNTIARKARKFLSVGRLQVVCDPADVDAAMDAYDAVYATSWKQPEPYSQFVRGWARLCAQHGWLRLGIASVDGQPIAAQFWFTIDRRAYIFKLAYDETQAKWSAGTLLTAHLLRHALEVDRVIEVDYLTGDDAYKKAWMTHRRERIGLMACNLRSIGGLGAAATEMASVATAPLRRRRVPTDA